jgi:hypothetical protein
VAVWAVIFTALFYWVMDYYTMPLIAQAVPLFVFTSPVTLFRRRQDW